MKKLLIFDAYGTLFSTGNGSIKAVEKILALQEQKIDAVTFYAKWKKYHRKHIDECNAGEFLPEKDIFAMDLKKLYEEYQIQRPYMQDVNIMLDSLIGRSVFPEVIDSIAILRECYRVVIGSTTDTDPLMENIKLNNLLTDRVYTSERMKKYKPAEEFYQYILDKENCEAKDAVFIGDSLIDDVSGPQKLGITTVLVDRKKKYRETEVIKPDYIVSSIAEMVELNL